MNECYCTPYLLDVKGIETNKLLKSDLEKIDFDNLGKNDKLYFILDNYIYPKSVSLNSVFIDYMLSDGIKQMPGNEHEKFSTDLNKLIKFANDKSISIIRFPHNTIHEEKRNPLTSNHKNLTNCITDPRNKSANFIMFVDEEKEVLSKAGLQLSEQWINVLCHEIGHILDSEKPMFPDEFESEMEHNKHRFKRETNAWEKAEQICTQLGIRDTNIKIQKNVALNNYYNFFFNKPLS